MIAIEATIKKTIPNAYQSSFEDGAFETFDAVELRINQPDKWQDDTLVIYIEKNADKSIWQKNGDVVSFKIDKKLLQETDVDIFADALEGVHNKTK